MRGELRRFLVYLTAVYLTLASGNHILMSGAQQGRQPLVIVTRTRFLDANGVERARHINTSAYRRDGSVATFRRVQVAAGQLGEIAEIVNAQQATRTTVDYSTRSISTEKLPDGAAARLALKPSCGELENAQGDEVQEFEGFAAVHEAFDLDMLHIERWVSPELDCMVMKEIQGPIEQNGQDGTTVIEVLSVELGEPLSHFFEVPSGFTERSPSELVAQRSLFEQRLAGIETPAVDQLAVPEEILRRADIRYRTNKPEETKPPSD